MGRCAEGRIAFQKMKDVAQSAEKMRHRTAKRCAPFTRMQQVDTELVHTLVNKRTPPAILIIGPKAKLTYLNSAASRIIETFQARGLRTGLERRDRDISGLIRRICAGYALATKRLPPVHPLDSQITMVDSGRDGVTYLFRAMPLSQKTNGQNADPLLVLIEKVSQSMRIDKVFRATKLTQREQSVSELLIQGKTNKEIGVHMEIGEHTVKDHVKRIMGKLKVDTRSGVVAKILQSH